MGRSEDIQEGNEEHRVRLLGTQQSVTPVVKLESIKEPNRMIPHIQAIGW